MVLKDDKSSLQLSVPSDWTIAHDTARAETDNNLRYKVLSPDKKQAIVVYVIASEREVDLDRLADLDGKLGWTLGKRAREQSIDRLTMRRDYERGAKGLYAAALFHAEGPFGYIVLALSTSPDVKFADSVFPSVVVKLPFASRAWRGVRSALSSVGGLVGVLLFWGVAYLLGRVGLLVRRGVETKRSLLKVLADAAKQGMERNEKYYATERRANLSILLPVCGFMILFGAAFTYLPIKSALLSLFVLIAPVLGYGGVLLGPSTDPEDYID